VRRGVAPGSTRPECLLTPAVDVALGAGLVVSGGQDKLIVAHAPSNPATPVLTLVGHENNVCALAVGTDARTGHPLLLSGSWDQTARVWDLATAETLHVLRGHGAAVWAVAVASADGGDVVTGSADKTLRLWRHGACVRTLTGHSDCIRAVAVVPSLGFLSASNDATVRLWSGDGEPLQELVGHTAYVYAVAQLPNGDVVSTGEDRALRVWRHGECAQTLLHPADSLWSVAVLTNGDVATAANDGLVRVFSRDPARAAPEAAQSAFDAAVAAHAIPAAAMDLDPSTVSGPEALTQPGRKEGEVKMVRQSDVIEAYQWSAASGQWDKVGVVTEVRPAVRPQLHGVEYDYVFDVDLEDGRPPRRLPYNRGENPFSAAQAFIHREELSQTFLDQIAQFIVRNTSQAGPAAGGASGARPPPAAAAAAPLAGTLPCCGRSTAQFA
jgi:phospholipase A-2-activating protein